jgi:hypothetical protein
MCNTILLVRICQNSITLSQQRQLPHSASNPQAAFTTNLPSLVAWEQQHQKPAAQPCHPVSPSCHPRRAQLSQAERAEMQVQQP